MVADLSSGTSGATHRPAWALPLLVIAILAVAVALVAGVRGLVANPVRSVSGGVATIEGSFQPYPCPSDDQHCAQGFVQAGSRGVFVRFPSGCRLPGREEHVVLRGIRAPELGKGAYRASACAGQ